MRFPLQVSWRPDKWQLGILAFTIVYAILVAANMNRLTMQWDEVNHFNGALRLLHGQIQDYIGMNSFYPPIFNLLTAAYYAVGGASVFTGRLVTLTFTLLSMYTIYQIGKQLYTKKAGSIAIVLFAVMPGIVVLSSMAMIETLLLFTFCCSMLFLFRWMQTNKKQDLILGIAAFIISVAVKYQTLVLAPIIAVISFFALGKGNIIKVEFQRFWHSRKAWFAVVLVFVCAVLFYAFYVSGLLEVWLYALQVGNPGQAAYSSRYPEPLFYLVEMVWRYSDQHPISLVLYLASLVGLIFFAYRRKPQDKFLLIWFLVTFAIFTLIPNKQWRYITLLFPVLALSTTELLTHTYERLRKNWQSPSVLTKKRLAKLGAAALIFVSLVGVSLSCYDAYVWVGGDQTSIPIQQAVEYVAPRTLDNQSVIVLCPFNLFNRDMVWFYANTKAQSLLQVYQYPALAVDAYMPNFSVSAFVNYCETNNTRYVLLYEYRETQTYFNSTLTEQSVYSMLNSTGRFSQETALGEAPDRLFVFSFN